MEKPVINQGRAIYELPIQKREIQKGKDLTA